VWEGREKCLGVHLDKKEKEKEKKKGYIRSVCVLVGTYSMPACDPVVLKYKLCMLRRAAMRLKAKAVMMDINVRKRRRALMRSAAVGAEIARRLAAVEGEYIEALQAATEALTTRFVAAASAAAFASSESRLFMQGRGTTFVRGSGLVWERAWRVPTFEGGSGTVWERMWGEVCGEEALEALEAAKGAAAA